MTVTYQKNVSNTSFMGFAKLLFKWRGSIYKLVFKELLMYGSAYAIISICYRFYMTEEQRRQFEKVSLYCNQTAGLMPMSFVLGFYVTFVVTRWWNQFLNLPWPDRITHTLAMYVNGADDRGRILRRTMVRYINLATIILFQTISGSAKKRFPTMTHLIEAGLMTHEEKQMFESIKVTVNKHWIPFIWFINLVNIAVKEGRIQPGEPVKQILEEMNNLRTKTGHLWGHDWVTVPLVYTQVVTLLTHLFFMTCLIGRQFLDPSQGYKGHDIDLYFPVYTFLQFFFFLGWLKVAEQLINPFGEDDDDFETNWFIDRNMQVCYAIVDEMYGKVAKFDKDPHWGTYSLDLPYTEAALVHKIPNYKGSTMNIVVPPREQIMVFGNAEEPPMQESEHRYSYVQNVFARYCCCCSIPCAPPLNK
ncbi:bestrophin-3-like [Stegodyphus dumicola]|uniref:bestrophin-3-like n=1 Tax=Stegodyphus dumicola TaxID=202533 RepID=UPI0015ADA73B|nr:bestrophin-3-like [Stegodyphus dumicola]